MDKVILTGILLFFCSVFSGQENIKVTQYTRADFKSDSQFWAVCEGEDGVLYFGNNDGVLVYDGVHWQKVMLPNNSSVRSLVKDSRGIIYAGGYDEAGIIAKDATGKYRYKSLIKELQPEGRNIENIWDIKEFSGRMLYRAYSEIIITSGKTATRIPSATTFTYSSIAGNNYYVEESGHGILMLQPVSNTLVMAFPSDSYNNEEVAEILPGEKPGTLTIVTLQGGVYFAELATGRILLMSRIFDRASGRVTCAVKNTDSSLYIGTVDSGIIAVNRTGEITRSIVAFSFLKDAVIQKLFRASDGNLWMLQNNGLAYGDYKSPYKLLFNKASVYDALPVDGNLYVATTQGVYFSSGATFADFNKVKGLQGQAWSVQQASGDIIASNDTGIYVIKNGTAVKIGDGTGFWKITPVQHRSGWYLASQYNGLYLLEKKEERWILHDKIEGFNESARDILPADDEPDTYWICHGYQGIFRVKINPAYTRISSVDHFTDKNGLENSFNVNVSRWQGHTVFTTNTGIYTFSKKHNRFVPFTMLNNVLDPTKNTRKLIEYGNHTWFVQDDEAGYFTTKSTAKLLHTDLFLNIKGTFNRGMECIVSLPGDRMLFGTTNGLFLYNVKNPDKPKDIRTVITGLSYVGKQEQQWLPLSSDTGESLQLPNRTDLLRFDFAAPKMTHGTEVQYSYILEGNDQSWSAWQKEPYKEYTHLRPGTYTLRVHSRNTAGLTGSEAVYNFAVLPKWYQTTWAYVIYGVVVLVIIYSIRLIVKRRIRYEKAKSAREAESRRRMLELELEQLKLQRDKEAVVRDKAQLEEDVINKSKELANYTMLLVQKKDFFSEITDDLKELKNYLRNEESRKKLLDIFQKLNRHRVGEEYMEVFDVHFEKVHHNFFEGLKVLSPSLTQRELRLCAFVKMGLSNKEIAPLLGISLRGVENARYRIRKKLNVANEDNFTAFLESVGKN